MLLDSVFFSDSSFVSVSFSTKFRHAAAHTPGANAPRVSAGANVASGLRPRTNGLASPGPLRRHSPNVDAFRRLTTGGCGASPNRLPLGPARLRRSAVEAPAFFANPAPLARRWVRILSARSRLGMSGAGGAAALRAGKVFSAGVFSRNQRVFCEFLAKAARRRICHLLFLAKIAVDNPKFLEISRDFSDFRRRHWFLCP